MRGLQRSIFGAISGSFLLIVAVSLIPAMLIIGLTGIEHGRYLEKTVRSDALRQVEALSFAQSSITESVRHTLTALAALPAFQTDAFDEQSQILKAVLEANPEYVNISRTDTRGIVRASARLQTGTDLSDRRHIQAALTGRGFVAGEYVLARVDEEPVFPYSLSLVNGDGKVTGTLSVVYLLRAYRTAFENMELPRETILGITDHKGLRLFFYPFKETNPVGIRIKQSVWDAIVSQGSSGTVADSGSDGIDRFYAYRKMHLPSSEDFYLCLVLGIPESVAREPSARILRRNLLIMGITVILSLGLSALLGYLTLGSRLVRIARAVNGIRSGDLSTRTGIISAGSGIGQIARAIDELAFTLETRNKERDATEARLSRALGEKEVLLQELQHRVKNNLQLILSIINLEKQGAEDIEQYSQQIENRIRSVTAVHELLFRSKNLSAIGAEEFIGELARLSSGMDAATTIRIVADVGTIPVRQLVPLALIINELITNSIKYGRNSSGQAVIRVGFSRTAETAQLTVEDEGPGFPVGFSPESSTGLGMKLLHSLALQLEGELSLGEGENGAGGAAVTVSFPVD